MQTNPADSAQANKTRQQSLVETVQNRGELGRIPEFIDQAVVDHSRPPGLPEGIDGVKAILGMIRAGFPDHDAKIVHMIAEGDLVATYKTFTGTNTGALFGAPPTGKKATIRVMDFVRYRDGKVAEHWNIVDMAGLMQQLGAA
jgi:steroid delta-isomerase-like uncharacterized protein